MFLDDRVWLPPGWDWQALSEQVVGPDHSTHMLQPIVYGLLLVVARKLFERCVARPLGVYLGLPSAPNVARQQAHKHVAVRSSGKSKLDKFCEHTWRFTFCSSTFVFGLCVLYDKEWAHQSWQFWLGYPQHPVSPDLTVYYKLSAAFYWSLSLTQFTDIQRRDHALMFVHHAATLLLIGLSWTLNFVRAGCVVLLIHVAADIWLDLMKTLRLLRLQRLTNICSVVFALVWFSTRCLILPYYVIYPCLVEAPALIVWYPVYYPLNALLLVLQTLHCIWSYMICKGIYALVTTGAPEDVRSDDEGD